MRRALIGLVVAAGCAGHAPAPRQAPVEGPAYVVIAATGEHARLLDQREHRVRIERDLRDLVLYQWVDRDALAPVLTRELTIADRVILRAGTPATLVADGVRAWAELPRDALGLTYPGAPDPHEVEPAQWDAWTSGAAIHAEPDARSRVVAEALAEIVFLDLPDPMPRGDWVEVTTLGRFITARGFIRTDEVMYARSCLAGPLIRPPEWKHHEPIEIPAGTCVYDDDTQEIIGEFRLTRTWDARGALDSDEELLVMVHLDDAWFEVAVGYRDGRWKRCDDRQ